MYEVRLRSCESNFYKASRGSKGAAGPTALARFMADEVCDGLEMVRYVGVETCEGRTEADG